MSSSTRISEAPAPHRVAAMQGGDRYGDQTAVEALVRSALAALELPESFLRPGDRVVLKPNWIRQSDERFSGPGHWEQVVTHPDVIEAMARWAAERLKGAGSITICDAPQTDSSFEALRAYCGLDAMLDRCRASFPGVAFSLLDLRPEEWSSVDGVTVSRRALPGDPLGSTVVQLNEQSHFVGFSGLGRLYGASFDMEETNRRHHDLIHEYRLARTPMEADVLINLPKLKTHKKVGLTCALKNLVGINADKNWLPHHTEGTPDRGGDQFPASTARAKLEHAWMGAAKRWVQRHPSLARLLVPLKKGGRLFFGDTKAVVRSGNWHGNDTCWRMVLDLNRCLFGFDGEGRRREKPLRYLALVDGIVAGEGNGPMAPDPKPCGVILAGTHPLAVDCVAASVMGFDWRKLRMLAGGFAPGPSPLADFPADALEVRSNRPAWNGPLAKMTETLHFRPHFGWVGAIERKAPEATQPRLGACTVNRD